MTGYFTWCWMRERERDGERFGERVLEEEGGRERDNQKEVERGRGGEWVREGER